MAVIALPMILLFSSCSSIQAGFYLLFLDDNNGELYLQNEPDVRIFMESIVDSYEDYSMKAFERTGINHKIKKTDLLTHCFYVISHNNGDYITLSFNGTKIKSYSEGAWAINTDTDTSSYRMYLDGNNLWSVREIFTDEKIDVRQTMKNIINAIDSDITYFYRSHIKRKPNKNNCITALYNTVAFEGEFATDAGENDTAERESAILESPDF